jgi:hypothetical protein
LVQAFKFNSGKFRETRTNREHEDRISLVYESRIKLETLDGNSTFALFFIGIVEGLVQLGPLGIAVTNRPIVPAPGDYDAGEISRMIGRETEVLGENLPQCLYVHHKRLMLTGREPGPLLWEASD